MMLGDVSEDLAEGRASGGGGRGGGGSSSAFKYTTNYILMVMLRFHYSEYHLNWSSILVPVQKH